MVQLSIVIMCFIGALPVHMRVIARSVSAKKKCKQPFDEAISCTDVSLRGGLWRRSNLANYAANPQNKFHSFIKTKNSSLTLPLKMEGDRNDFLIRLQTEVPVSNKPLTFQGRGWRGFLFIWGNKFTLNTTDVTMRKGDCFFEDSSQWHALKNTFANYRPFDTSEIGHSGTFQFSRTFPFNIFPHPVEKTGC
jgi:hypothetical protein